MVCHHINVNLGTRTVCYSYAVGTSHSDVPENIQVATVSALTDIRGVTLTLQLQANGFHQRFDIRLKVLLCYSLNMNSYLCLYLICYCVCQ